MRAAAQLRPQEPHFRGLSTGRPLGPRRPDSDAATRDLVWNAEFDSIEQAFAFEKRISGWRRDKKEAVIRGDYDDLPALSRRKRVQDKERPQAEAEDGG